MKKTARAGALVVMPIGLAVQAHAAVALPTNGSCNVGTNCTPSTTQLAEVNGFEGLSIAAGGTGSAFSSGGSGEFFDLTLDANGLLALDSNGSNCNGVGNPCELDSFQISWGASMEPESGAPGFPPPQGSANITSFDSAGVFVELDGSVLFSQFSSGGTFSDSTGGTATVAVPAEFQSKVASLVAGDSGSSVDLSVIFSFGFSAPPGGGYVDTSGDFSITGVETTTPEPASSGLVLGGLLGIGAWLRRRKRR